MGWGITPFEGNYYISRKYLRTRGFKPNYIPGLCFYKFLYVWLDLHLADGHKIRNLGWLYWFPNPLFPFIWYMATGDTFGFDRGEELGLLNSVIDADDRDDFENKILEYASQFTTPNKASKAVGHIKRAVQTGGELPFEQALTLERELQQQLFQSDDAREGLNAYIDKRSAEFTGR